MARIPKPWYRKSRKTWFVQLNGTQINLGPDKEEAHRQFHALLARKPSQPKTDHLAVLLDRFLEWVAKNRPRSFRWYRDYMQSFLDKYPALRTEDLRVYHVDQWAGGDRGKVTAMKRALNWADEMGLIESNPIRHMKRPKEKGRRGMVTLPEFKKILRLSDKPFRDMLIFCWDCGCRPQEAKSIEARHIHGDRIILPQDEAKGQRERTIYVATDRAKRILSRLMKDGKIFRNSRGNPWTASAVKCRFARMEEKLGKRFRQYDWRHSFITRKLRAGVDSHVVAKLAGHVDTRQIDKTYSHIAEDHDFLLEQARREGT